MINEVNKLRNEGKRIGFTASSFDLLHAGHIAMLSEAKSHCDFLVVGILVDPTFDRPDTKNKPIQSIFERWMQLQAISYVDLIVPFESEKDLYDVLLTIDPDIRFVGEEYKGTKFTGHDIEDIEIYFNQRKHFFSTTDLRKRVLEKAEETKFLSDEDKTHDVEEKSRKLKE